RMLVEHALDPDRGDYAVRGLEPVRLAAAEPEAPLPVEVAEVAHAVQDAVAVPDLRQAVGLWGVVIGGADQEPTDDDLSDLAGGEGEIVAPPVDGLLGDPDDADLGKRRGAAHAGAGAARRLLPRLVEDLRAADVGHRQGLRGAVRREHLGSIGEDLPEATVQ